jgi:phosphate:Na+ symporter
MRFKQTIGIILGAAIGTTITAQIIAFKLTDYSLLLIGIGFLLYLIPKKSVYKNVGEAILGFGILFFGMQVMSEAMYPLRSYEPFINILLQLENPVLGILVGAMLTALIQSSSAFIGIMIILGTQGFLTLEASIPLLIGANLGTAITAILASLSANREAKQVALAHTLFKVAGALILVWWIPQFVRLIEWISFVEPHKGLEVTGYLPREIANAHTVYNVMLTLLFLPLTEIYTRFINFLLPYKEEKEFLPVTKYLDENMLKTPSLALNLAKQEVLHMISIVRKMAVNIIVPFMEKRTDMIPLIDQYDLEVNFLRDEINDYILQITRQKIDKERAEEAFQLLYAVNEFEQIADIISSNLKSKAISWSSTVYEFSTRGKNEIMNYHIATLKQIDRSYELYQDFSLSKALKMKEKYEKFREMSFALEKQHYNRLIAEEEKTINSSKTHLELMTMLKLIGSHATNTARILIKNSM